MIKSSVTICLVPEAAAGPFVFHGNLEASCQEAAELGFDAVEIFGPSGRCVDPVHLQTLLDHHGLKLSAVGTGAGMLLHGHSLSAADKRARAEARSFVREIIEFGAQFGAPAIIGSMQGLAGGPKARDAALGRLAESLSELAGFSAESGTNLLFEPLNRYETDLVRTLADGMAMIETVQADNLRLLADLFHMNIEEVNLYETICEAGSAIGHVHFVDSNRRAAGMGHMQYQPICAGLRDASYKGYVSAEAFPLPDSSRAAKATIEAYRRHLAPRSA